jgi:phosphatidate phosphatase APP1
MASIYRSFRSDELPGIALEISWQDRIVPTTTDAEGYFRAAIPLHGSAGDASSIEVTVRVTDPQVGVRHIESKVEVIIPPPSTEFLVISDLDDTVIETNVTARLRMLRTVLLRNARSRSATPGMARFIERLHHGSDGTRMNPLFYVSGGPWNLYTLYRDFLDLQNFPRGAIMLADFGIEADMLIHPAHDVHKSERIGQIIATYPNMSLVLVGDSGEHDPQIYRNIANAHPGRVRAIYIRDVGNSPLVEEAAEAPTLVFRDAADALSDAEKRGLAHPSPP